MREESMTIEAKIQALALETDAPATFIQQVRNLFVTKGIPLGEDSTPYLAALREAFRREERIRRSTRTARHNLDRLQSHFSRIGNQYRRQLDQLRKIKSTLEKHSRQIESRSRNRSWTGTTTRENPPLVTRTEKDGRVMVPGPDEVQ